jgi:DNA-binding SARP family transcriptional activator
MEFRILGPLEVSDRGRTLALGPAKQQTLLAILLLRANEVVSSDRLIEELWTEPPPTAANTLQVYVGRLRKALEPARPPGAASVILSTRSPGYVLHVGPGRLDSERFEGLVAEGRRAREADENEVARQRLRTALALWRGRALADFLYEPFAQTEIARLEELHVDALEDRFDVELALGRHAQLVAELEALVAEHPLRERLRGQLMLALYRCDRQAHALEVYREARRTLVDELGIEPSPLLRRLETAILNQDAALEQPSRWLLGGGAQATIPAAPVHSRGDGALRKTVTVLMAGAAGDMRLDPEALARFGGDLRDAASSAARRYGGEVTSVRSDEVTVVFGVPSVHEDDARRAVAAALEIREALATRPATGPGAGIGIATGEVLVGGDDSPSVIGDPVSAAQRLKAGTGPGEILLADETHRLLGGQARAAALEAASGRAWRLIRLSRDPPLLARPPTRALVGRGTELRRLQQALDRTTRERTAQLVSIAGPPGIGKSRLVAEFTVEAGAAMTLAGRCVPYGEGITFRPLREIIERLGGPGSLRGLLADEDRGDLTIKRLSGSADVAESVSGTEEIFWAAGALFAALARRAPLVVVLEDVHWAEPTFLDLIAYLHGALSDAPVLLLCVARPELLELRPDWGTTKSASETVLVGPLPAAEAKLLIEGLLPGLETDVRTRVLQAAEGNPLFIEQLLASLAEAEGEVTELSIPPTIQAVLAARLDRLGPGERAVVARAAVIGRDFSVEAATALLPSDARPFAPRHVQTLMEKDLIEPVHGPSSREKLRFRHALIQQAAYRAIPKRARAELHESFGTWVKQREAPAEPAQAESVGYHLEQAFRYRSELGPVTASERALGQRAADLLGAAGGLAFRRGDMPAAANLLGRAASLHRATGEAALEFLPDLAYALFEIGELERADSVLAEAESAASERGQTGIEWGSRAKRLHVRLYSDPKGQNLHELVAKARHAVDVLAEVGDDAGLARAWVLLSEAHYTEGRVIAAEHAADRAAEHARRYGSRREEAWAHGHKAYCLIYGPTPVPEGLRWIRALLAHVPGSPVMEANMLPFLASLEAMSGHLVEARAHVARGRALNLDLGLNWQSAIHAWLSGEIEMVAGDPAAAERDYRASREACERIGDAWFLSVVAVSLPPALYAQGRYDEAWNQVEAAIAEAPSGAMDVEWQIRRRGVHAKLLARSGDPEQGEVLAREAVDLAAASEFLGLHADALLDLAEIFETTDHPREAVTTLAEAVRRYEQKGNVVAARRARQAIAAFT